MFPVRSGVYQRRHTQFSDYLCFSYFNARTKVWSTGFTSWDDLGCYTPEEDAVMTGASTIPDLEFEWRGEAR